MPSLLHRLGAMLMAAIRPKLIRCGTDGLQPWVPACQCVVDLAVPPAEATISGVFCSDHVRRFEEHDPTADDDVRPVCIECLRKRGLIPGGTTRVWEINS